MSDSSKTAKDVLQKLIKAKLITKEAKLSEDTLVLGTGSLVLPTDGFQASWRRTVNRSLMPRSVSSENRRQLMYAVLQDLLRPELQLHNDGTVARPLSELDKKLAPFQSVYQILVASSGNEPRKLFFPMHASVPLVYDTYKRTPKLGGPDAGDKAGHHAQTDKGFRGAFVHFFSCGTDGTKDHRLIDSLSDFFASTNSLSVLDRLFVAGLVQTLKKDSRWEKYAAELGGLRPNTMIDSIESNDYSAGWRKLFRTRDGSDSFRPLPAFVKQGQRIRADIQAITSASGLSRLSQVAAIESVLGYHFSLYLLRLTNELDQELAKSCEWLQKDGQGPWRRPPVFVLYQDRRQRAQELWKIDYERLLTRLNEAYLLLPVLNAVELALRVARGKTEVRMQDLAWAEIAESSPSEEEADRARQIIRFWAAMVRHFTRTDFSDSDLRDRPIEVLFDALRFYYTLPDQQRLPGNHHGLVFEQASSFGPDSFRQVRPWKHFAMGEQLLQTLAFITFKPTDRRIPLADFVKRLEEDLILPANAKAKESFIESLRSIGLIDRLSDVGEAHFLRRPTSV